jgi:hypothetical protein
MKLGTIRSPRYDLGTCVASSFAETAIVCDFARLMETLLENNVMLDHVSLGVTDIERSRHFYDAALRPLGLVRIVDFGKGRGSDYGAAPGSLGVEFTITREAQVRTPIPGAHICFRAPTARLSTYFIRRRLPTGDRTMACRVFARVITPTTTVPS